VRYALGRVSYAVFILLLASVVTFLALRATPGNISNSLINPATTPPEVIAELRSDLGFDDSLPKQYWDHASGVLTGDLGFSLSNRTPVSDLIKDAGLYTLALAAAAFLIAFGLGVPFGMLSAINAGGWFDRVLRLACSVAQSIPNFVLALVAVLIFGVKLGWLPVSGANSWKSLVLPAVVLAAEPGALTTRVTRTAVLEELGADYTRTLRSRGLTKRRINWIHVLRNSLSPIISLGAVQIRTLLGYTLVVEVIFRWPGLGTKLVDAVLDRDYPVAEVLALLLAAVVVGSNTLSDLLYRWADPRVRLSKSDT